MGDQPVLQRVAVARLVVGEELDLHPRHVDTGRAFALAALAADAEIHRLVHRLAGECVWAELAGQGETQGVGAAAGQVLLVACHAIARAHGAGIELAAMAVVVAHLDGFGEAAGYVAAAAGRRDRFRDRVVLHVPGRPVELRLQGDDLVRPRGARRREAEQRAIVHVRRIDDLAGVEQTDRIELLFDGAQSFGDSRAELPGDPFAAAEAVAMFAAIGALVLAHQLGGLFGDGAHLGCAALRPGPTHVEDRAHVQGTDRGMGIPGAAGAVLREHRRQRVGVVGEVLERHRAILDEADRFAVALQAHHDVEPGLPHLPEAPLRRVVDYLDHAVRQTEIAHHLDHASAARAALF
jgi:hypothetical protein